MGLPLCGFRRPIRVPVWPGPEIHFAVQTAGETFPRYLDRSCAAIEYGLVILALTLGLPVMSWHSFERHFPRPKDRFPTRAEGARG